MFSRICDSERRARLDALPQYSIVFICNALLVLAVLSRRSEWVMPPSGRKLETWNQRHDSTSRASAFLLQLFKFPRPSVSSAAALDLHVSPEMVFVQVER